MQAVVDMGPVTAAYHCDALAVYQALVYTPGQHTAHLDTSATYSVESDNAELRHYLARLARLARCFSRCITALRRAVQLLVWCWNQRQLWKQQHPRYPAHLIQFVPPPC